MSTKGELLHNHNHHHHNHHQHHHHHTRRCRVQELVTMFNLTQVADVKIGKAALDKSKVRLLSIATELCNRPGLIYMEDPGMSDR